MATPRSGNHGRLHHLPAGLYFGHGSDNQGLSLQYGLVPWLMWPLTLQEVPLSKVEKLERLVNSYARKWLGLPRCLSSIELYGKGILELPISSLAKEYKCGKVRLEIM